ncbi:MAG: T9SS type A sorting domain-containing protein [Ignavibacteriales bacterium]|nr:T9SS type A sorting domain-containing protein [Ignavibacteriales bacterium]
MFKTSTKLILFTFSLFYLFTTTNYLAQRTRSAIPESILKQDKFTFPEMRNSFLTPKETNGNFSTTVYTFASIAVFSYFDNTQISVYDANGTLKESKTLGVDSYYNFTSGISTGIYRVVGNKTYTVLVGDAFDTRQYYGGVDGYYAVDEAGRGLSTKLNTYMTKSYDGGEDFIVFSYNDNTGFTVKDLTSGNILAAGTLNTGEHYSFKNSNTVPYSKFLQVIGTKPISALSYADQDYYVPSSNGSFVGTSFYGYSAYVGSWDNSIVVTSYADNNTVTVKNSSTGAVIKTYTIQKGQVKAENINTPTFWTVTSTGPVSAANIPFTYTTSAYQYMTRAIDENGKGFGKLFYVPTIGSRIDIFSFDNANTIKITELGSYDVFPYTNSTVKYQGALEEGKNYTFTSATGRYVYKIEATGNVSVLQSNSGAGADFMPLAYSLDYPDLAISTADIAYNKADTDINAGDNITVTVTVHNYGNVAASNVNCVAYDGDPDAGGNAPIIGSGVLSSISVNGTNTFYFTYKVPTSPEYRNIVVKVDPANLITESNESNNKASRSIKPNVELQPPLAVSITTPSSLLLQSGTLTPNPFTVHLDIFNTGTVSATNVSVKLDLFNGLTLASGTLTQSVGTILSNKTATVDFSVRANASNSGFNLYKLTISATGLTDKVINKAVNVPDAISPTAPTNFTGQLTGTGSATFNWTKNTEPDLSGYYFYYSIDGTNWTATGASQGNSPILVINANSITLTNLPGGKNYWFMVKAFDTSNNISSASTIVQLSISGQTSTQTLFYGDKGITWTVTPSDPPVPGEIPGYVFGPNKYGDLGKYQRFDFNGTGNLAEVKIYFAAKTITGAADNFNLVVRSVGTNGAPNTLLYSQAYSTNVIDISNKGVVFNSFTISPQVFFSGSFFVGLEWASSFDDQFGIIADTVGQGNNQRRAWEKWSDESLKDVYLEWGDKHFDLDLWIAAVINVLTDVKENGNSIPSQYTLFQNYPNPFNPTTRIRYLIPTGSFVQLKIFDVLGNEVASLVKAQQPAGYHEVEFNAANLSSGIYFYRLQTDNYSVSKKLILMK